MSLTISSLYFSPIKSLSFQNIKKATIKKQIGILHDRILAFSRGVDLTKAKQIEQDPTQRELINSEFFLELYTIIEIKLENPKTDIPTVTSSIMIIVPPLLNVLLNRLLRFQYY